MKIVQIPPDIHALLNRPNSAGLVELFKRASAPEATQFFSQMNERYVHWHELQHRPLPVGWSPQDAWIYLKMIRGANRKPVPFSDKRGNHFSYWIPDVIFRALNAIDRWSGEIIGAEEPGPLPSKERYIISSLMEEAIASSQLEGAATTRRIAKDMLRSGRKPKNVDERMIVNNWRIIEYLRGNRTLRLTPGVLREIHATVTEGTLKDANEVGQFRRRDDIYVEYRGESVHTPPLAHALPERIERFCSFANYDDEAQWVHPVLKGAMLHFWLAYDHPFTDGNGRTARALFYWYMLSRRYWLFEYLAISRYILRAPGQYVRAYLHTETDGNDLTYFLQYNLRAIQLAFGELRQYLQRKQHEITRSNELLTRYRGLNARQKNLIYHAIRHPGATYTLQVHRNVQAIAYDTARHDFLGLEKRGFFLKERQGKVFVYKPSPRIIEQLRQSSFVSKQPSEK